MCFSIGVIGSAIEKTFLFSYFTAFFIALIFIRLSQKTTRKLTFKAQQDHVEMNTVLLYGWDTILADNFYNKKIWDNALKNSARRAMISGNPKLKNV